MHPRWCADTAPTGSSAVSSTATAWRWTRSWCGSSAPRCIHRAVPEKCWTGVSHESRSRRPAPGPRRFLPTIFVHGRRDRIVALASSVGLHRAIPHSRLVVLAEAGHSPQLDAPTRSSAWLANSRRRARSIPTRVRGRRTAPYRGRRSRTPPFRPHQRGEVDNGSSSLARQGDRGYRWCPRHRVRHRERVAEIVAQVAIGDIDLATVTESGAAIGAYACGLDVSDPPRSGLPRRR